MIDAWWLAPAIAIGIILGIALSILAILIAATMRSLPMDGRTYTGHLGELDDDVDQFLRDLNETRDTP